jgi:hypothetical protein
MHLKIEKALQAVAPVELLHLKIGTQEFHLKAVAATVRASEDWNPRIPSASCYYYGWISEDWNPKISICKLLFVGESEDLEPKNSICWLWVQLKIGT